MAFSQRLVHFRMYNQENDHHPSIYEEGNDSRPYLMGFEDLNRCSFLFLKLAEERINVVTL